jgi:uncharacterized protein (UPF0218 family)
MPIHPNDAQLLKQPFGTLILDKELTKQKVASMLQGAKKVVAVGDATTERLVRFGIVPDVAVIDGRERRLRRTYPANYTAKELKCRNLAGTISKDAVKILQEALKTVPPTRVTVEGEEDLLALPAIALAPEGSTILYGQPLEGLVVVKISLAKQKQAKDLMERIMDNANLLDSSEQDKTVGSPPRNRKNRITNPKKRARKERK